MSNNKRKFEFSFNVAYCGIMCAFSTLVMFIAIVPSLTYIMPALAGMIIWSVREQIDYKWAWLTYVAAALLAFFLVPEWEAKTLFILIFGYYPLLREKIHKHTKRVGSRLVKMLGFFVKLIFFNVTAVISYLLIMNVFGVGDVLEGLEGFGEYAVYAFWAIGNAVFILYDFALRYVFFAFVHWIKPSINKKIK